MNNMTVVYKITNLINNKIYIGSSKNYNKRKYMHLHNLKLNKHHNKHLQSSFNKYGECNFNFNIVEECLKEDLIKKEQYYIDTLKPEYNICKIAGSIEGIKRSEETKRKISESNKGKVLSKEARIKISKSLTGRKNKPHSLESKIKMSESRKGKCSLTKEQLYDRTLKSLDKTRKVIYQINDKDEILNTFISISEAARHFKCKPKRISAVVTGTRKHYKNLFFKYA